MKNFRWIMMVVVSVCFIIGTGSQGWSAEVQKGTATIEPQKKPIVIRDSTLKSKPPPLMSTPPLKANLICAHMSGALISMEPPVISPTAIHIWNKGPGTVKKGGKISWVSPGFPPVEKQSGIITLTSDLKKGMRIYAEAKLLIGTVAPQTCKVSVEKYVPPQRAKPPTPPVRKK